MTLFHQQTWSLDLPGRCLELGEEFLGRVLSCQGGWLFFIRKACLRYKFITVFYVLKTHLMKRKIHNFSTLIAWSIVHIITFLMSILSCLLSFIFD